MNDYTAKMPTGNDEGINFDEIPEITDFSKAVTNPFAGKFKNGYAIIVEHPDCDEIITVKKNKTA